MLSLTDHRHDPVLVALSIAVGAAGAMDLDGIGGVYKRRFTNETVHGERFPSEDVVEIVRTSPTSAYLKTRLNFYDGHQCAFAVVADVEDESLVYRSRPGDPTYPSALCVLTVSVVGDRSMFHDEGQVCRRAMCGTRGGYDGVTIERRTRRPIRYLKLRRDSTDYRRAISDHDTP